MASQDTPTIQATAVPAHQVRACTGLLRFAVRYRGIRLERAKEFDKSVVTGTIVFDWFAVGDQSYVLGARLDFVPIPAATSTLAHYDFSCSNDLVTHQYGGGLPAHPAPEIPI